MGSQEVRARLEILRLLAVQSSKRYHTVSGKKELDLVDLLTERGRLQRFYWRGRYVKAEGGDFYGSLPCENHESFGYGFRQHYAVAGILVRDGEMGCSWSALRFLVIWSSLV